MSTKIQTVQQRGNIKGIAKKIRCPDHKQKYLFKCEHPNCQNPFICGSLDCIDSHLHEGKIIMSKFNTQVISSKFYEVDTNIADDTIYENARYLKNYIDGLKQSIKNVYVGIKNLNQNYDYLKGDIEGPLTLEYIAKVQENYFLNQTVRKNLDQLKDKVKIDFPVKDSYFSFRTPLIEFLSQNIPGFNWAKSKELHSSKSDPITCEKFHDKLAGITDLLFIFVGQSKIIGSFYACQYPTIAQKTKKDPKSFLFVSGKDGQTYKFFKFQAYEHADQHIAISQKTYICHGNTASYADGIRTFQRNFDSIEYCLPSNTYRTPDYNEQQFNGPLKVRRFMILQVIRDKPILGYEQQSDQVHEIKQNGVNHNSEV